MALYLFLNISCKILCELIISFSVFGLIVVGIHAILRLIWYGELASLVLWCEMVSPKRTEETRVANDESEETIKNKVKEKMKKLHYSGYVSPDSVSMYMSRLSLGCFDFYRAKHLIESEEPFDKKWMSWRYVGWRGAVIIALLPLALMIGFIAITNS